MRRLSNRGDTIVEVMICLAVMSFIIVLAYGTASRSLKQSRQSQERVEAVKLLESQMERIKAFSSSDTLFVAPTTPFCYTTGNVRQTVDSPAGNCRFNNLYNVSAEYEDNLYTVRVVWDNATGNGQDQAEMYYRIY